MKKWLIAVVAVFMLAACSNDEDNLTTKEVEEVIEEGTIGFEMAGETIEKATNVPKDQRAAILAAFDEYIAAFNAMDIERYKQTISEEATGFDYNEDIDAAIQVFEQYDVNRQIADVTIVKYEENQAQVFANLTTEMTELESGTDLQATGRQVTVFTKEEDTWKVSSIYYIGNE